MEQNIRSNPHKAFVKVRADHDISGQITPLKFRQENGDAVTIERILDARPAPSLKAGGQGMRYTCRVDGKELYLFHDRNLWFIELD